MYVLIDYDEMNVLAKHPDFAVLTELGVIICPEAQTVFPLEPDQFNQFDATQIQLLYINLTENYAGAPYDRDLVNHILTDYINELPETILDSKRVAAQAEFCVTWDIQGLCSYDPRKDVPNMEEGLWKPLTCTYSMERENAILGGDLSIEYKAPKQPEYTHRRERSS
ncbi:hypothetical protein [Hafnia phage yong3]|nr:hypothetical protein [Hafnia phage yong3]